MRFTTGFCQVSTDCRVEASVADSRVTAALHRWLGESERDGSTVGSGSPTTVFVVVDRNAMPNREGYHLKVSPGTVQLTGGSAAGCFYGIQTLAQLSKPGEGLISCGEITDYPDFATRGLLHDVTRGKVPKLDTLKTLAARLASLKINQLQLNIEHAFVFSFDPEICDSRNGLTPHEIRELDRYCRERFINLVPALATIGHMGRILSMPRYRHLAEIEGKLTWDRMDWPQRMRGLTLDCSSPEAFSLIEQMWIDVLQAFSSPVVNICGDEPWDLGEGKNKEAFSSTGKGRPYVRHLRKTHDICASHGRRTQFWSDVVRNYPDLLDRLPRDATVLHWGYDDQADYEGTAGFVEAGLETFVCPGTSGWKRIIPAMDLAERNIATFADAGTRHGATGLINTDWGDHGHFNTLAGSWHGFALGAACGWRSDHPTGEPFDARFAYHHFGTPDSCGVALLRSASAIAAQYETWRLFWIPLTTLQNEPGLPNEAELHQTAQAAAEAARWLEDRSGAVGTDQQDLRELLLACRFTELFVDKIRFARRSGANPPESTASPGQREAWAETLAALTDEFADCWRMRNKDSGLDDITRMLEDLGREIRPGGA